MRVATSPSSTSSDAGESVCMHAQHTHEQAHAYTHARAHTHTHTHNHTQTHARTHGSTHARTHARAHTHTHRRIWLRPLGAVELPWYLKPCTCKTCTCSGVCVCARERVCVCVRERVSIFVCTCACVWVKRIAVIADIQLQIFVSAHNLRAQAQITAKGCSTGSPGCTCSSISVGNGERGCGSTRHPRVSVRGEHAH